MNDRLLRREEVGENPLWDHPNDYLSSHALRPIPGAHQGRPARRSLAGIRNRSLAGWPSARGRPSPRRLKTIQKRRAP